MNATPKKTENPRPSYTFDAIPEDESKQDELNRRMRKPGEPGYRPPAQKDDAIDSESSGAADKPATDSRQG